MDKEEINLWPDNVFEMPKENPWDTFGYEKIDVYRFHHEAKLPHKGRDSDLGFDIFCVSDENWEEGTTTFNHDFYFVF